MTTREFCCVCGSVYVASTPTAVPFSVRIRSAKVLGSSFAPASDASCRIGAQRALLGAGLIAHPAVPDQVRVVSVRVDVERGNAVGVPELGRALRQPLVGGVLGGDLVVAADAVEHRLQVFVERRGVDVGEAEVVRPSRRGRWPGSATSWTS